jgi:hypothetical protein
MRFKSLLIVCLLVGAVAVEAGGLPPHTVIRVHASYFGGGHGLVYWDEDLFILNDGTVTASLTRESPTTSLPPPAWYAHIGTGAGTADDLATLYQALADGHVGIQSGGCAIQACAPISGTYEITWYGRGVRRNTFVLSLDEPPPFPLCPPEVNAIVVAIEGYAAKAGVPVSGAGFCS